MTGGPLVCAYQELGRLVAANPSLMSFAGWHDAEPRLKRPRPIPAAAILRDWAGDHAATTAALGDAVRAAADLAAWQRTYTEDEVGADFLARYGWFELIGPTGHFHAEYMRAYIAYWGENLHYPWHLHEAEELYFILGGRALFESDGLAPQMLGPGDTCMHLANQPHRMTTTDSPVLALVLWRGAGLTGVPRMGSA